MARYQPYAYHKRQPVFLQRPFDPVDSARYEAEERAWNEERFSLYQPFPSIQAWYANGCLPQRGPDGWLTVTPKWLLQGNNPTSPIYDNQPEEERGSAMHSPTACLMSPLSLGPSRKPDAPPPQGSVLLETIAKGRSLLFECGVDEQEAKGVEEQEEEEEEEEEEVVLSHAPDPHADSEEEDEVPLSHFVVHGKLKEVAPVAPPPDAEPGVYMDDDDAENGKFAWKWTLAMPAAKEGEEEKGGDGGGDSDFYDDDDDDDD